MIFSIKRGCVLMKKLVCVIIFTVFLGGIGSLPAVSVPRSTDETLIPYLNVITRLNRELKLNMYIFDKEKLLDSVKNKTPAEFEATLRSEAKTADPNYREPSKFDNFQAGNGIKTKRMNRSSATGKSSGPIPLPNAQGKLEITLLE